VKKTLLLLLLLVNCLDARCCDCGRGIISVKDFNTNDWIFVGTLLREGNAADTFSRICVYKVVIAYRGVMQGDTVKIYDARSMGACGLGRLTIGADYLMYAAGGQQKWTSICRGNSRRPVYILPRDSAMVYHLKAYNYRGGLDDTSYTTFHSDTAFLSRHAPKAMQNGPQKFYNRDGQIAAEGCYSNGLPEGFWRYYGQEKSAEYGKYRAGKKDSLWVTQYGTTKYIEGYKDGAYTYEQTAYSNGKIDHKKGPVGDGKKWIAIGYHDNGKPRYIAYTHPPQQNEKGILKDPVWDGLSRTFNKVGILLEEGLLQDGLSVGHWKYYYEDGKLRMEGDYSNGEKSGTWKIYYPNKRVKASGNYDKNEKSGDWQYYNPQGKTIPPDPDLIKEDEDWFTYSGVKK
jgi:antitoxin component YwqK of YwqJK toxin-antitoxin module